MSEWKDITEAASQTEPLGEVEFMVKTFGKWDLGYSWVDLKVGGGAVTCLALYAKRRGREGHKTVVWGIKSVVGFFAGLRVPPKASARVMAAAGKTRNIEERDGHSFGALLS